MIQTQINGYPVIGQAKTLTGEILPILGIKVLDDNDLKRLQIENAVKNFIYFTGSKPENEQQALDWQRERWGHKHDKQRRKKTGLF